MVKRKLFFTLWSALLIPILTFSQEDSTQEVAKLMNLSLEELMNVKVVTASGFLQTTNEAPSTVTVISSQQITERGYDQLEDALRDVPGIDLIHINGYAPTLIYFRGMYGAENLRALLMIDGIVENNILGSNDLAGPAYSLHNIDRIEIIWGPVSALYGANAFGGVINMITKKGEAIDGISAEQGFGSFNTRFQNINMGLRKGHYEFSVSGRLYSSDGPKFRNRDPNYSGSYVDKAYSFNGMLSYYARKSKTTIGYRTYVTPIGWGTYSNSPSTYLHIPPQGNLNQGIVGVMQRDFRGEKSGLDEAYDRTLFLQTEYKPTDHFNLTARVVYRETGVSEDSYIYITADGNRMYRLPIATYSSRLDGEVSANYVLSEKQRLSAGVEFYQDNVEAGSRKSVIDPTTIYLVDGRDTVLNLNGTFLPRDFDVRNNFGSYLQYIYSANLLGKTSFTGGLRYDNNSYFGDALSPRLAIVNQPNDQWTFKLQYGTAFRAPTNLEIYQTPPTSNFKLKKEKIRTYEVNLIYSASKNMRFQFNGFRNELTDVIILGNLSGFNADKNPGVFRITGFEAIADGAVKNFSGFLNFTYQHTYGKNLITGFTSSLPGVAKLKGNIGLTAHLEDLFTVSVSGNWIGDRTTPRTDPIGVVKGYFLTNLTLGTTKLFNDRVYASISIRNLFDVKWLDPGFRTADGLLYSTVLEQPGINGIFKVGVSF